jgi:RNA polymerase sigma-70 factor (ECF subfamily)
MNATTDEALMLSVRKGETRQLGILFKRHSAALFDFFCRMTGNRAASEDLVQDVFFRILKYRTTYRSEARFTTWMYQIARNVRFDHLKSLPFEVPILEESFKISGKAPSPGYELEQRQRSEQIRRALLLLSEEKRELLVLAKYRELEYAELAVLFDVDVNVIKVRLYRAVKELREICLKLSGEKKHAMRTS